MNIDLFSLTIGLIALGLAIYLKRLELRRNRSFTEYKSIKRR